MKRNSTTLFLESPGATTSVLWVDNAPDFSIFTDPTLSVLQKSWQDFVDSGEQLEIIPDPDPPTPEPDWTAFNLEMIPPNTESSFELWAGQFKEAYRMVLFSFSAQGLLTETQAQYDRLKNISPPTPEQIAEWQDAANRNNIGLTF